jgi:putative transposase
MRLVTLIHTQRRHAHRASAGTGHLYQGRFKSFVVQHDAHFLGVARYVEANALSAGLVTKAEDWRWGSLWRRLRGNVAPLLDDWPVTRPSDWVEYVNRKPEAPEVETLRRCAQRGSPYGAETWVETIAEQLGLKSTMRPRGRPGKDKDHLTLFAQKGS